MYSQASGFRATANSAAPRIQRQAGNRRVFAPVAGLMAAAWLAAAALPAGAQAADWAPGRLVVHAKAGLSDANVGKLVAVHGGKAKRMGGSNLFVIELPANASETAVLSVLKNNPHFKFAELDHRIAPLMATNDPYSGSAWHLGKIGAPTAWDTSLGAGVTIAVLDSGVDASHPDLVSRVVPGWNFYDNNGDTSDVYGHGTQVAGAAAATLNNALGVPSVAGQAFLMPIRVSDTAGYGYTSMIANGLIYAADRGVKVANISFANMPSRSAVVSAAQYMKDKGGLVVVAAGNTGTDLGFTPTTSMVTVSATTSTDEKASWSSFGSYVALAAPGAGIYTTTRGGGYTAASGTSVASPVAAGVAALTFAANATLKGADVERILFSTAMDLGVAGRDSLFGYGRVNAAAAVASGRSFVSTADTQAPSVAFNSLAAGTTVGGLVAIDVTASDNVGVTRVDLLVNGSKVASDTAAPYAFSWDSSTTPNGTANISAVAYDAAGNSRSTAVLALNVANAADLTPPVVTIGNPNNGSKVSGTVSISVNATDNSGTAGLSLRLLVNGKQVATSTGGTLSYNWNTRKIAVGTYILTATATDKAGNASSGAVTVSR